MIRRPLFWLDVMIVLYLLILAAALSSCGGAPSRTIPKGMPYPKRLYGPVLRVYPMAQLRCLGGGIGGCSLGGKAQ